MKEMGAMKTEGELDPRIKIRAPLRCDGVGRLECAEDVESGERLAIRWLPLAANGVAAARVLESIPSHPTLPRIRETGQVGQSAYVAMHFPDGRLISALAAPLAPQVVARMGASVAAALAAVHSQGVVHGELSADSVLLLEEGKYTLWDLPLVLANRLTDRRKEERAVAQLLKSAAYLSPERARGGEPSAEADVYGLGVVLCVAAGMPLPAGLSTMALIHQVATGQWRASPPAELPTALSEAIRALLDVAPLGRPHPARAAELLGSVASALQSQAPANAGPALVSRPPLSSESVLLSGKGSPDDLL
jgi:serine/threonine protein kinase